MKYDINNHPKINLLKNFISSQQLQAVQEATSEGEEYIISLLDRLAAEIEATPLTYAQDGKGEEAIAYLHYFIGGHDWYISERDMGDGTETPEDTEQWQAFGKAQLNGNSPELGYIPIKELIENNVELDFYFTPKTFKDLWLEGLLK